MNAPAPRGPYAFLALLLACSLASAGCNVFTDDEPSSVRVVLEGGDGLPILLVTSSDFEVVADQNGENRDVFVFSADSTQVSSPFEREYPLGSRTRFYFTMTSDSTAAESNAATVRVYIDGERRYQRTTVFGEEVIEYLYTFR